MVEQKVVVKNKHGLHARPSALLVKTASEHRSCNIYLSRDGQVINGKSIMGVMMLAANLGSEITITVQGENEEQALASLVKLFEEKFNEE